MSSVVDGSGAMAWYEGRSRLKLTGYRSAEEVEVVFGSVLVDTAYVIEVTADAVYIVADSPTWPTDLRTTSGFVRSSRRH